MRNTSAVPRHVAVKSSGAQIAALPYRVTEAGLEILLITSRRTRRWVVPKGWLEEGASPAANAAREAMEEAGISGEVDERPLGSFHYLKDMKHGPDVHCRVDLFPLKVTRQRKNWRERAAREAKWFSLAEAAAAVGEPELKRLILKFGARNHASPRH
ncbi:MAG: NUDIX hydrolase [Rhizomicrobium sp.]